MGKPDLKEAKSQVWQSYVGSDRCLILKAQKDGWSPGFLLSLMVVLCPN